MERNPLSLDELAVLLADPADGSAGGSEAEDLRRRLAADAPPLRDQTLAGERSATVAGSTAPLDDWPGPKRLAGRLVEAWSELLRTDVAVSVLHVASATFGEFLLRCRCPIFLATAARSWGSPVLAVDVPLTVLCPAIRRMSGGPWELESEPGQSLTPLEQRLAKRLAGCLVSEALAMAGDPGPPEDLPLVVHERLPRVAPAWARTPAAEVQLLVKLGIVSGPLRCCVPWPT